MPVNSSAASPESAAGTGNATLMWRNVVALGAGTLFGIGLTISQMINPAKVLGFFDLFGQWDPSLAFVMAGGLLVTLPGYRLLFRRAGPHLDERYHVPDNQRIDRRLIGGAVLFGVGWGLVGLCPGPSLAALGIGGAGAWLFFAAMVTGMWLQQRLLP